MDIHASMCSTDWGRSVAAQRIPVLLRSQVIGSRAQSIRFSNPRPWPALAARPNHEPACRATAVDCGCFVDIVGPCNLSCVMCPQGMSEGTRGERGSGFMSVHLFRRVLTHLRATGYAGESVNLYNWGDPLLHPELGGILDACEEQGYVPIVSTNLSFPEKRIQSLTSHKIGLLLVSVSGFSQETYAMNHRGGSFALIRKNLDLLQRHRGRLCSIVLKYLIFRYNHEEIERARADAGDAAFEFGAYLGAIRLPSPSLIIRRTTLTDVQLIDISCQVAWRRVRHDSVRSPRL